MGYDLAFSLTKVAALLASPFLLALLLLIVGAACLWVSRAARAGRVVVSAGLVLLLLLGWSPVAERALRQYEFRYQPLTGQAVLPDSAWVVVLGGGANANPRTAPIGWLTESSLARLTEGIRVQRTIPGSRLLVTGAALSDSISTARALALAALSLGVDPAAIVMEERPRNTAEEAAHVAERAGGRSIILVTSASHMPRAVRLFAQHGMEVVPAPTDYWAARHASPRSWVNYLLPATSNVRKLERATYELVAGMRR
jgi:uncharacterized SAM-binding protein YcdF (DUF218 family)